MTGKLDYLENADDGRNAGRREGFLQRGFVIVVHGLGGRPIQPLPKGWRGFQG
ncbi:hypothetical protein [Mesorhizobium sp. M0130]|uniref:hypothetical protein n=1 Tax=Mesorhizobium sp. M0130 TaxID=2956887 RepID=UPI00333D4173